MSDARSSKLVFAFPGLMPFDSGTALALLESVPESRTILETCDAIIRRAAGWSIKPYLFENPPDVTIADCAYCYPLTLSVQIATVECLRARGIEPDAVVGVSAGEVASAYTAGALGIADALRVSLKTGAFIMRFASQLRMVRVWLPRLECEEALMPFSGRLSVCASLEADVTIVSGRGDAIEAFVGAMTDASVQTRVLPFEFGAHNALLETTRARLVDSLRCIRPRAPSRRVMSTVTGDWLNEAAEFGPDYWWGHAARPVRFRAAVATLLDEGYGTFLEIGSVSAFSKIIPGLGGRVAPGGALLRQLAEGTSRERSSPEP